MSLRATLFLWTLVPILFFISLALGSFKIPIAEVWQALVQRDLSRNADLIVWELRVPRGFLALCVGASLGLAGGIIQSLTRNPLAEPGFLGVNAGAALAMVLGAALLDLNSLNQFVWLAIMGAGLGSILVVALSRSPAGVVDPIRLILAGVALTLAFGAAASLVLLNYGVAVLDDFRHWSAGTLESRDMLAVHVAIIGLLCGALVAFYLAPSLDAYALGPDAGQMLGVRLPWLMGGACLAIMLLAGSATAVAGPIAFVGLAAPHAARKLVGGHCRKLLFFSAYFGALILLVSDVLGRIVASPREVAAGVIVAILGGPLFVWIARRLRAAPL